MPNDYFLHFTAEKKRNSAKDKKSPEMLQVGG